MAYTPPTGTVSFNLVSNIKPSANSTLDFNLGASTSTRMFVGSVPIPLAFRGDVLITAAYLGAVTLWEI